MFKKSYLLGLLMTLMLSLTACGGTVETNPTELNVNINRQADPTRVGQLAAAAEANADVAASEVSDAIEQLSEAVPVNPTEVSEAVEQLAEVGGTNLETMPASLQEKIAELNPDGDGSVTLTISDDELTQAIATAQGAVANRGQTPIFQGAAFQFSNNQITFSAMVNGERFSGEMVIVFTPYLTNNVLQLELVSATADGRSIPPAALQPVEDNLNSILQEIFSQLPPAISLDAVTIQEGLLIITGSINP